MTEPTITLLNNEALQNSAPPEGQMALTFEEFYPYTFMTEFN
jgi:hypothetical protein